MWACQSLGSGIQGSKVGIECLKHVETCWKMLKLPIHNDLCSLTLSSRSEGWSHMESTLNVPHIVRARSKPHLSGSNDVVETPLALPGVSNGGGSTGFFILGTWPNPCSIWDCWNKMKWCLAHLWDLGKWHVLKNSEVAEGLWKGNLQDSHRLQQRTPCVNSFLRQQASGIPPTSIHRCFTDSIP